MSNSSHPSLGDEPGALSGRVLPSFTPLRDRSQGSDKPESSGSSSRRSARSSSHGGPAKIPDSPTFRNSQEAGYLGRANGTVRRSRPHSSGGFLLENALHPSRMSRTFLLRSKKERTSDKGKGVQEEEELKIPKRWTRGSRHEQRSSIGSSPLATEIKQDTDIGLVRDSSNHVPGTDIRYSSSSRSQRFDTGDSSNGPGSRQPQPVQPNVGFDTDPAQIVSMALTLGEKRRRQVSGMRMVSRDTKGSRVVSSPVNTTTPVVAAYRNQYVTPERQGPKKSSALGTPSPRQNGGTPEPDQMYVGGDNVADQDMTESNASLLTSQATAPRVQNAKTYFELAYEHRRLLQHLPPVRRPGASVPTSARDSQTKVYNPLQYVRNRKLRFMAKHPILSEAEGWHDIQQVRAWVDAIIEGHPSTRFDPDECVRLPDLAHKKAANSEDEEDEEQKDLMPLDSPASSARRLHTTQHAKPRRPRSDWVTHPGDLIADAHWLEQGQNKLKIEDRDGNHIYPPETQLKFSGWRNRTPINIPDGLHGPMSPSEDPGKDIPTPPPSALPELPTFKSAYDYSKLEKRGRRRGNIKNRLGSAAIDRGDSQDRQTGALDGSHDLFDSSSSGEASNDEGNSRGRKLISRKRQRLHGNRTVEPGTEERKSMFEHDTVQQYQSSGEHSHEQSAPTSKPPSLEHSRLSKLFTRDSKTHSSKHTSKSRSGSTRRDSNAMNQRNSYDGGNAPRSSAEYDTTAPSSPTAAGFLSIAINLSPPTSRSPSPSKKVLPSILNPFRDRSHSKAREGIEANDFGIAASKQQSRHSSGDGDVAQESSGASRGTSPMTRGTSPMTKAISLPATVHEPQHAGDDHRGSTASKVSTKSSVLSTTEGQSKVRGVFKGGRIAQLVGNEVSRVGDFIWKRDVPAPYRARRSTSTTSLDSYHASDTDEDIYQNGNVMRTPPPVGQKRSPTTETDGTRAQRLSPTDSLSSPDSGEKVGSQYHNPNLPTFISPFQRDRDNQAEKRRTLTRRSSSPQTKEEQDHISRLAAQHRSASRSPRLDRLAPPRLDISRPSTPPGTLSVDPNYRRDSYGFGDHLTTNQSRDLSKSRNASQVFNDALKPNGTMVTGLTGLKASRSGGDLTRASNWNVSNQDLTSEAPMESNVRTSDIARTRALLLSSAIKAREIVLRADAYRSPVPSFLAKTLPADTDPASIHVMRKDEHILAARNLITRLTRDAQLFQVRLTSFQTERMPNLHRALQELEDRVDGENGMTHTINKIEAATGDLTVKMSTTSTLAVKGVSERIDAAIRRRRRGPVRWLRRFGYLCIEWVVVALLWGIWAAVMVLRVGTGSARLVWSAGKWLLFLE